MTAGRPASSNVREAARIVLQWLGELPEGPHGYHVLRSDRQSNQVDEVHLEDGRILVVKRARDPAMADRFRTSRLVSQLLSPLPGVVAPRYLTPPPQLEDEPVLIYWWVPGPTLHELWPSLDESRRPEVLESWGAMIRRIQAVRLPGYGPVIRAREERSIGDFLERDLGERLLPAVCSDWPEAAPAVRGLLGAVPRLSRERRGEEAVVVHNDLFDQNVLCRRMDGDVTCAGAIDFEDALAAPPEAELAKTEILHGPLFGQPWKGEWLESVVAGWGGEPDPFTIGFFRAHQLLHMGFHAHVNGMTGHAREVAAVAQQEVEELGAGRCHRGICDRALS